MEQRELELVEGTVSVVIYQNEDNGYTVLRLDAGDGSGLTVVGCMPGVAPGESISVQGSWVRHASYGEQFKAEVARRGWSPTFICESAGTQAEDALEMKELYRAAQGAP